MDRHTHARALCATLAAVIVLFAGAPATAAVRPPGAAWPLGDERLSDEFNITRWAHSNGRGKVRRAPSAAARTIGRLRLFTEDKFPEVYLVLQSRFVNSVLWYEIRLPGRPNGRRGWVVSEALGSLHLVRTHLRVNRRTLRATLYKSGKRIWTSRIGVGKSGTPTPKGRFWIRERMRNLGGSGVYGPWAFGTAAYSRLSEWPGGGVIGIHGTNQPYLIPGRPSHGCIRVPNAKVRKLARLMPVGTPVQIL